MFRIKTPVSIPVSPAYSRIVYSGIQQFSNACLPGSLQNFDDGNMEPKKPSCDGMIRPDAFFLKFFPL
jgi:hypothetical protein